MSRRGRNNHYHYAEQYTDGAYRRRAKAARVLHLPRRAVFFAMIVLLVFGVITATFSAEYSTAEPSDDGALIVRVRNTKVAQDYMTEGMEKEEAYAVTGANAGYAETGGNPSSGSAYYYSGTGTSWAQPSSSSQMINVDNVYCYRSIGSMSANANHEFKIFTGANWNSTQSARMYGSFNTSTGDVSINNIAPSWANNSDDDNNKNLNFGFNAAKSNIYLLAFYPNTTVNSEGYAVCCVYQASSVDDLPRFADKWDLQGVINSTDDSTWGVLAFDIDTTPYSATLTSNTSSICKVVKEYVVTKSGTSSVIESYSNNWYGNNNAITYANKSRTLTTSGNNVTVTAAALGGTHTFSFNSSSKVLSVAYPTYTVTTAVVADEGTTTNTVTATSTTVEIGSSVQLTASTDATYSFDKWTVTAGSANTGSYASGTDVNANNNTDKSNNPITIYPCGSDATVTLQANYKINKYNITYNADATPATATGQISNPVNNGVPTGDKKTHGANYTITSNTFTRDGYTQKGWATSANYTSLSGASFYAFGATYSTDAALTLYPVWQLNTPCKSSSSNSAPTIVANGSMTIGSTPVDLGLEVKAKSDDVTRTYEAHISTDPDGPSASNAAVGVVPSDTSTFMKFSATEPGTYYVYITVTDVSNTGVINANDTAYANTTSATINVTPDVPQFSISAYNVNTDPNLYGEPRDGSSSRRAYMVLLGNRYYFSAQVDPTYLLSHPASSYTYTWSTNADFAQSHIVGTGTSIQFTNVIVPNSNPRQYTVTEIHYDPANPPANPEDDPRTLAEESDAIMHTVILYCRATCNGASNDNTIQPVYYFIQPLIKSFEYEPMQKIFNMNDQTVTLAAEYNISDDPDYLTDLKFANDNYNFISALDAPEHGFIHSFVNAIRAYLYPNGPKYFYILMNGINSLGEPIESKSDTIHTTVGTADSTASRTLYFNNPVGTDETNLKSYLVMCYYVDGSGNLCYQTAQDMHKGDEDNEGKNYRVMIPQDTQSVCFGFLQYDRFDNPCYGSLSIGAGGAIGGFTSTIYYGYTDQVILSADTRTITKTSEAVSNGMRVFSCTSDGS